MAPGWTSTGSVDEASSGFFRVGVDLGLARGLREALRVGVGGFLRGAMSDAER